MNGPDPRNPHPMAGFPQVCFIKNTVKNPNIVIGDYTYYDDPENSEDFERNVLYHYPFVGDKLILGKFCAIARGVKFIMNGANHQMSGLTTYPFSIFGGGWEKVTPSLSQLPIKGDTVVGNDVWLGYDALIMPGVKIGNGAIVASRSTVVKDIPPYEIWGGNPAVKIRARYAEKEIALLEEIAWWDWDVDRITEHLSVLVGGDVEALRDVSRQLRRRHP